MPVTFTFDPATVVQLAIAVVLPILVGLVTTPVTGSSRKAVLPAVLTLVTSLLTELDQALAAGVTYDIDIELPDGEALDVR
jgi:hypothetical protein